MSDIKFLVDDFTYEDKKNLHGIEEQVQKSPKKTDKNTVFLRKFVLAMMKQYYIPKHKTLENLNQQIKFAMPNIRNVVPYLLPKAPDKLDMNSFMPKVPIKVELLKTPKIMPLPEQKHIEELRIPKPV